MPRQHEGGSTQPRKTCAWVFATVCLSVAPMACAPTQTATPPSSVATVDD